jgi:benzodiazapine receptor
MTYPMNNANKINALLQLAAFVLMIALNAAANILPINGYNTGEISAMFPNYFVPAGFTFGIWSVLYLLQAWWVLLSLKIAYGKEDDLSAVAMVSLLMPYFSLACLLNGVWILCWHFLIIGGSLVVMILLLLVLIALYFQLRAFTVPPEGWISWVIPIVFVTYLAWISVATIANASAYLVRLGVNDFIFSGSVWSAIMMMVALLLSLWIGVKKKEPAFAFVLTWAFFGIYKGQLSESVMVGYTALGACVISFFVGIYAALNKAKQSAIDGVL